MRSSTRFRSRSRSPTQAARRSSPRTRRSSTWSATSSRRSPASRRPIPGGSRTSVRASISSPARSCDRSTAARTTARCRSSSSGTCVDGDEGKPALLLGVVNDMSEKRRLDQQLVQSGKLAAIGELAAGVAHEINNPLFAILGLTEFLLKEAEPGSKARAATRSDPADGPGDQGDRACAARLCPRKCRRTSRGCARRRDPLDGRPDPPNERPQGVELVDTYADDGALVSASPNQLKQIFLNLIANARQAMPNGGSVGIQVHRDGDHVIAVVSDDGPGIAPTRSSASSSPSSRRSASPAGPASACRSASESPSRTAAR